MLGQERPKCWVSDGNAKQGETGLPHVKHAIFCAQGAFCVIQQHIRFSLRRTSMTKLGRLITPIPRLLGHQRNDN